MTELRNSIEQPARGGSVKRISIGAGWGEDDIFRRYLPESEQIKEIFETSFLLAFAFASRTASEFSSIPRTVPALSEAIKPIAKALYTPSTLAPLILDGSGKRKASRA